MSNKIYLIISSSTKHLGLFDDLEKSQNAVIKTTDIKKLNNFVSRALRRIYFKLHKYIYKWYEYGDVLNMKDIHSVLIIDTAMAEIDLDFLYALKKKNIKVYLYFINSLQAESPMLKVALKKIRDFSFDKVFSFDKIDCLRYGYDYLGFNYYSKHELPPKDDFVEAYFIGTIKGGRGKLIRDVFKYLQSNNIKTKFDVRSKDIDYFEEGMNRITGKWIPYSDVLQSVSNTNCIVEIMQNNQAGPTLRYFEAVVYNKKLISNNPHIKNYPYYDEHYMRYIKEPSDIDIDWLKKDLKVEYNYNFDFSPVNLIEFIQGVK